MSERAKGDSPGYRPRLEVVETRLESGLRVLAARLPTHRTAVAVHTRTGSRFEPADLGGVSHFLEHMLHRGTPSHPSAYALALAFEELGSELGAATYVDHGILYTEAPHENLEAVIDVLGEVVKSPIYTEIETERAIVREEILETLNDKGEPVDADELLARLAFPDHPLGLPITGSISALDRFDVATLRRFHAEHYGAEGMVVSVCGPIDPERVTRAVERAFAGLPRHTKLEDRVPPPLVGPRLAYVTDPGSQTAVRLAFRAPAERDPLESATELLVRVLSDGASTRLYHVVCDQRGLAYDVSATYEAFADSGLLELAADAAPERVIPLLEAFFGVVRDLAAHGPSPAEVERVKRRFVWHTRVLFDSPLDVVEFLGLAALTDTSRDPWERAAEIERVPLAEVHRAARELFVPNNLALAVVGQLGKKRQKELEELTASFGVRTAKAN